MVYVQCRPASNSHPAFSAVQVSTAHELQPVDVGWRRLIGTAAVNSLQALQPFLGV